STHRRAGAARLAIQRCFRISHPHTRSGVPPHRDFWAPAAEGWVTGMPESDFASAQLAIEPTQRLHKAADALLAAGTTIGFFALVILGLTIERLWVFIGFIVAMVAL